MEGQKVGNFPSELSIAGSKRGVRSLKVYNPDDPPRPSRPGPTDDDYDDDGYDDGGYGRG